MKYGSTGRAAGTPLLECYISPAGIAVATERVRLGVQEVYVSMRDAFELEPIAMFGQTIIAALADR